MSALAEALAAAQRRAIGALEKAYVAGSLEPDALRESLTAMGCADAVDQAKLTFALDVIREHGAQLPAEAKPAANGDAEPAKATDAQVSFALSLFSRTGTEPLVLSDMKNMPRERMSALIESLKAGSYDATEWDVPF